MKFSIITPIYNAEKYLERSINSILNQSYQKWELILVNDGSSDGSEFICKKYQKLDTRIKYLYQENKGPFSARIAGIKLGTGDYFMFLDSDDYYDNDALYKLANALDSNKTDILVYNHKIVDSNDDIIKINEHIYKGNIQINKDRVLKDFLLTNKLNSLCTKVIKRDLILEIEENFKNIHKIIQSEDFLFLVPIMLKSKSIHFLDLPIYNYRLNVKGTTHNFSLKNLQDTIYVNELTEKILLQNDQSYVEYIYKNRGIRSLGLYLRYTALNKTSKKQKLDILTMITNSELFQKSSIYVKGKNKIAYNLLKNKNIIILNILTSFNKFRIRKQLAK